ncbi:MAG TPA: hypothetical protein VNZ06_13480 [Steroidobacteraceae bacterium]|jgi:hypothetical protein|nr:hypothetical protein [Steroidobacteraceae bacterium]
MKRLVITGMVLFAQLAAAPVFAGNCSEPTPFTEIPSGASATREQMLAAQRAMKAYDIAVKAFSDCLKDAGDTSNRANVAIDKLEHMAQRFNVELHAFKERNGAS